MDIANPCTIALAGNPNVGKSTVFNALTGLHQHTGNWPGKTVSNASGTFSHKNKTFTLIDLPGTYSLHSCSQEEKIAEAYIRSNEAALVVCVADATCLQRNLILVQQLLRLTPHVALCVNLLDEARKKGISIDLNLLSEELQIPVIGTSARDNPELTELKDLIYSQTASSDASAPPAEPSEEIIDWVDVSHQYIRRSMEIADKCVSTATSEPHGFDRKIDKVLTSRRFGIPIMLLLLCLIFWITITGANYPSQMLSNFFASLKQPIWDLLISIGVSSWLQQLLMDGLYTTLTWVISVMLPPMAIFFPMFTLLEDSGYLPRIAFNLDHFFQKAHAHGKQALTMCMGFGCNACGVIGCRIIDSPRERLIAILTNNFVPCNGRFPTLIALITIFFASGALMESTFLSGLTAALLLTGVILLGIVMTIITSRLLSSTVLKGIPSSFTLELPPYRRPQWKQVIIRSVLDRTLFVLGRAIVIAAPAGIVIWLAANTYFHGTSILAYCTDFLDPFAAWFGLDGVILMAFILGFPANEIVIPIMLMTYLSAGSLVDMESPAQLLLLLQSNGWTWVTALCTIIICLMHFPCGTTCLTIYKETRSLRWTALSALIPTAWGLVFCFVINALFG